MEKPIIEIKNVGKMYNITHQQGNYVTLRDTISNIIKNPLSFGKHKVKEIIGVETKEDFWALKNIDLEIKKGETVGIIGRNGAGKSTLLKMLSKITPPTTGEIKIRGRLASLLEVGTGFHPELTGRENIFLNGAILGMTRIEITKKFNQIVEFSGIEKFLDTPVKKYSSGMYVRLAFAVAAHIEPDVLIVDEVLAVGDAEFQKRCLGKMEDVTKKHGRTILFVSHNMSAIQRLCSKTILLKNGKISAMGNTNEVVRSYLSASNTENKQHKTSYEYTSNDLLIMQIKKISIRNKEGNYSAKIAMGESFHIELEYDVKTEIDEVKISIILINSEGTRVLHSIDIEDCHIYAKKMPGSYKANIIMPNYLNADTYNAYIVFESGEQTLDKKDDLVFEIINKNNLAYQPKSRGIIIPKLDWNIHKK